MHQYKERYAYPNMRLICVKKGLFLWRVIYVLCGSTVKEPKKVQSLYRQIGAYSVSCFFRQMYMLKEFNCRIQDRNIGDGGVLNYVYWALAPGG